ncbi:MAG: 30S ribosomal protein S6 [Phycisphaerales bacterium]
MSESKGRNRQYEAMFLISPTVAAEMENLLSEINAYFERIEAEVVAFSKWDERRLAYEIDKNKRGVYLLAYFTCDPVKVVELERLCNLSENILRTMITSAEHLTREEMQVVENRQEMAMEANLREGEPAGS